MNRARFGRWEAVTFDASGTLFEPWPSVGHVYAGVAAGQGLGEFDPADLTQRFLAAWQGSTGFDHTRQAWLDVVRRSFAGLVPDADVPQLFEAIYVRFASGRSWRVPADVRPCLDALKSAGVRLGVISNFDERLMPLLSDLGLAPYFQAVLASGLLGVHKPDTRLFHEAAAHLGAAPDRILHAGDSRREDFEGARAAGFGSVLLDREGTNREPTALKSLAELPGWMAGLRSRRAD